MATGDQFAFFVEGLDSLKGNLDELARGLLVNGSRSINDTLTFMRAEGQRIMQTEILFPSGYLNPAAGRLTVSRTASPDNLEGAIRGRQRPTSLSRFSIGAKGTPPIVAVRAGRGGKLMKHAFLLSLRSGNSETRGNLGLALRVKKGQRVTGSHGSPVEISPGLFLLYGPSVDQAFRNLIERDNKFSDEAADHLELTFRRLTGLS